jgi:hypothetical protein
VLCSDGGGYSYRLCPRTEKLTEECFQRMPLDFTGLSSLRWDGLNGKRIWFNATTIAGEYTTPTNSQWRKTPIPVIDVSSINQSESSLSPCTDSRAELFLFVEHSTAHDIWGGLYVCVCVCVCVCVAAGGRRPRWQDCRPGLSSGLPGAPSSRC